MTTETKEIERLSKIYEDLEPNKRQVVDGLIVQAARLRVQMDKLWKTLKKDGFTEMFSQSEKQEPYVREKPEAALFLKADKNYQSIIKQLNELTPPSKRESKLQKIMKDG